MKKEIEKEEILTELKKTRIKNGLTRHFVAEKLGLCDTYFGKIEIGVFTLTLDKIKILAGLYNLPDEVIFREAMEGVGIRDKRRKEGAR
jgi:transcriptional regulator with XRE-family HTH domain